MVEIPRRNTVDMAGSVGRCGARSRSDFDAQRLNGVGGRQGCRERSVLRTTLNQQTRLPDSSKIHIHLMRGQRSISADVSMCIFYWGYLQKEMQPYKISRGFSPLM